jgi:signal transduction histidine kinase
LSISVYSPQKGYFVAVFENITERKKAEEKLLDNQAQLKQLASQLTLAEERERRRIADGLHDQISQSLASSKIELDALRHCVSPKDPDKALKEVSDSIGEAINDMRSLTFDLSYPILYELGFEAAVAEWLTERIEERHRIATEFEDDGQPKPLDEDVRVLLFRDVRELLMNVVKHAQAKKVKVSIRKVGRQIQVRVEDDGIGFDPEKVAATAVRRGGFGLFSIRERLEQLGGHLEIDSEPGHGTRVTLIAPLKQQNTKGRQK